MDITTTEAGSVTIVELPGDKLDASNANDCKDTLHPVIDQHDKVVVDLSQLGFIDSSGLGALLSCLRRQTSSGGELKLCGLSKSIRALFELVRMHRVFDIHNTREEALAASQGAGG
jgi:anti-sigma B factor antagonist